MIGSRDVIHISKTLRNNGDQTTTSRLFRIGKIMGLKATSEFSREMVIGQKSNINVLQRHTKLDH